MARHLGELEREEFRTIQSGLVNWLKKHDVSGSIANVYDLYAALEREWEKARRTLQKARKDTDQ